MHRPHVWSKTFDYMFFSEHRRIRNVSTPWPLVEKAFPQWCVCFDQARNQGGECGRLWSVGLIEGWQRGLLQSMFGSFCWVCCSLNAQSGPGHLLWLSVEIPVWLEQPLEERRDQGNHLCRRHLEIRRHLLQRCPEGRPCPSSLLTTSRFVCCRALARLWSSDNNKNQ